MAVRNWTPQQQAAIDTAGGTLLVSAAAGSGKTAVLVQRVIQKILDEENPVDADRLLVVTFSNAAASEMKERIVAQLAELSQQQPENLRLKGQILKMEQAHISTVHAFCLDLIREEAHTLDLEADFRIADDNELKILLSTTVHECVEQCYERDESGEFCALAELISSGRDDSRLIKTILRLYAFVRSHPFYEDWLREKLDFYRTQGPLGATVWGKEILEYTKDVLRYAMGLCQRGIQLMQGDQALQKAYLGAFQADCQLLEELLGRCGQADWDGVYALLHPLKFSPLGRLSNYEDTARKDLAQGLRAQVKKLLTQLAQHQFCATGEEALEDIGAAYPKVKSLFEAVQLLCRRMWEKKRERRIIDFSDMEHLALKLLVEQTPDGARRTEFARQLSQRFHEVLVDEFQDTNEVQDLIFRAVSQDEENLFLVGDVKQSIYRFRQAMPEIFLEKKRSYHPLVPGENPQFPAVLVLDRNFRSRVQITDSVNFIFRQLMSRELGEIEYDDSECLVCGASYPPAPDRGCRLTLIDCTDKGDDYTREEAEAAYIASQIRRMVQEGYPVSENGVLRGAKYRDFAVLMRSPSFRSATYIRAMQAAGVPLWADLPAGFLENREILAVVSLLRALDNPLGDIPLVAAMLSELFWFSEDEIAQIRLTDRKRPMYLSLLALREDPRWEKAAGFLEEFERLRTLATVLPADRLIQRIYDDTGFVQSIQAQPDAQDRRENLFLLMEYAARYEQMGYRGLWGLVRFLDELGEQGADLSPAVTFSESADVVKLMSVHRSKGLEFPVVFLADTARQFNREDLRSPTLLHSQMGFACVGRDPQLAVQYPTVPHEALKLKLESASLSEEMRVLYVALTRAKETLILTGALENPQKKLESLAMSLTDSPKLPPHLLRSASCPLDWLLECLLRHPDAAQVREMASADGQIVLEDGAHWEFSIVPGEAPSREEARRMGEFTAPDEQLVEELAREISCRYPHEEATRIPSKLGVSELAHQQSQAQFRFRRRPAFLSGEELSATQQGQAMHTFLQFADYDLARKNVEEELQRMVRLQFLSPQQAQTIRPARLRAFFASSLAQRMFAAKAVWREVKFLQQVKASELGYDTGLETITVQGVADCVFQEEDGAVLIDYKTDRVKTLEELVERYAPQLRWYRRMVQDSLGIPVKECRIYSLHLSGDILVE